LRLVNVDCCGSLLIVLLMMLIVVNCGGLQISVTDRW